MDLKDINLMNGPNDELRHPRSASANTRRLLDRLAERRQKIGGFRAKANIRRTPTQRAADWLNRRMGSVPFLMFHLGLFLFWFGVNLRVIQLAQPFDMYPFGLLTMLLTLEQSLLTIFIIISQNRSADLAELRNEIDLQVNVLAEEEISKALKLLRLIGEKLDIDEIINDGELRIMETSLDHEAMEKETLQELGSKVQRIIAATEWTDPDL
jgi:uncharacterized membrane protein